MGIVGWIVLLGLAVGAYGLEALFGRWVLRRHLADEGWILRRASWRPLLPLRQVRFRVEVEQAGQLRRGTVRLGGPWTGPVFSNRIEFDWHES